MVTEKDVIEILKKAFDPEKAADLKKKFVAEYAVEGGETWHVIIENKTATFIEGPAEKKICKMTFDSVESWRQLASKELDGIAAFTMGKVKIEGPRAALEKLGTMMGTL